MAKTIPAIVLGSAQRWHSNSLLGPLRFSPPCVSGALAWCVAHATVHGLTRRPCAALGWPPDVSTRVAGDAAARACMPCLHQVRSDVDRPVLSPRSPPPVGRPAAAAPPRQAALDHGRGQRAELSSCAHGGKKGVRCKRGVPGGTWAVQGGGKVRGIRVWGGWGGWVASRGWVGRASGAPCVDLGPLVVSVDDREEEGDVDP